MLLSCYDSRRGETDCLSCVVFGVLTGCVHGAGQRGGSSVHGPEVITTDVSLLVFKTPFFLSCFDCFMVMVGQFGVCKKAESMGYLLLRLFLWACSGVYLEPLVCQHHVHEQVRPRSSVARRP